MLEAFAMHFHVLSVPGSAKKHMANFKSLLLHKFPRGCLLLKKVVLPVMEKKKNGIIPKSSDPQDDHCVDNIPRSLSHNVMTREITESAYQDKASTEW